jgi:hypothetical protein
MVACGRARRIDEELVKLLLRSDGLFPSAVTHHTRKLWRRVSKSMQVVPYRKMIPRVEVTESGSKIEGLVLWDPTRGSMDFDVCLSAMDGNPSILETGSPMAPS